MFTAGKLDNNTRGCVLFSCAIHYVVDTCCGDHAFICEFLFCFVARIFCCNKGVKSVVVIRG